MEELGPVLGSVTVTPPVLVIVSFVVPSFVVGLRLVLPVPEVGREEEIGRLLGVSDGVLLPVATGAVVLLPYVGVDGVETVGTGVAVTGANVSLTVAGMLGFA